MARSLEACEELRSSCQEYNVVAGEFHPDGTCSISVDGESLFKPNEHQRTWIDGNQLVCAILRPSGQPDVRFNHVRVSLYNSPGDLLKPGRYEIDDTYPPEGKPGRGGIAGWDERLNPDSGAIGKYHLSAVQGSFQLDRGDSTAAVGRFTVRAKKKWSMS